MFTIISILCLLSLINLIKKKNYIIRFFKTFDAYDKIYFIIKVFNIFFV